MSEKETKKETKKEKEVVVPRLIMNNIIKLQNMGKRIALLEEKVVEVKKRFNEGHEELDRFLMEYERLELKKKTQFCHLYAELIGQGWSTQLEGLTASYSKYSSQIMGKRK